jgi:aspartate kinase (EC 2.7.2.4)
MKIRNSFSTNNEGTLVTASPSVSVKNTVKCVSYVRNNGLIDIRGGSMVGTPGTAAKIFSTFSKKLELM